MSMGGIKAQGVHAGAMPAEATVSVIAASDIGAYVGARLEHLDFSGASVVHLQGPAAITQTQIVGTLGQAIGKPVRYVQVTLADLEQGLRQGGLKHSLVSLYMEMYRGAGQGLLAPEAGGVVLAMPTTFATFAEKVFAPAYRA